MNLTRGEVLRYQWFVNGPCIAHLCGKMLKIRRSEEKGFVVFVLSGRIDEPHVTELRKLLEAEAKVADVTFDLEEVRLVDREAVRFLAACKTRGIKLKNCPSYIREWIDTGSNTNYET